MTQKVKGGEDRAGLAGEREQQNVRHVHSLSPIVWDKETGSERSCADALSLRNRVFAGRFGVDAPNVCVIRGPAGGRLRRPPERPGTETEGEMRQDSPVRIPTFLLSALAAVVVLAVPFVVPPQLYTGSVVVVVALLAATVSALFPRITGLGAPLAVSCLLALSGGAAIATTVLAPAPQRLLWWALVLGSSVLALFLAQLLRGTGATDRVSSLALAIAGAFVVDSGAGWVAWYLDLARGIDGWRWAAWLCAAIGVLLALAVTWALNRRVDAGWGAPEAAQSSTGRRAAHAEQQPAVGAVPDDAARPGLLHSSASAVSAVLAVGLVLDLIARPLMG